MKESMAESMSENMVKACSDPLAASALDHNMRDITLDVE